MANRWTVQLEYGRDRGRLSRIWLCPALASHEDLLSHDIGLILVIDIGARRRPEEHQRAPAFDHRCRPHASHGLSSSIPFTVRATG